jgi:F0F1-type ATP synthase assembly protein I
VIVKGHPPGGFRAKESRTEKDDRLLQKEALRFVAVGLEMGVAVFIGVFGGRYLDAWLETRPVFFWVGLTLGLGAAGKAIWDAATRARKTLERNDP